MARIMTEGEVEGGRVVETAVKGKLKDYGTTSAIWSEAFLNYTAILTYFFGREVPLLNTRLLAFHNEVMLAGVYQWQEAALCLAALSLITSGRC